MRLPALSTLEGSTELPYVICMAHLAGGTLDQRHPASTRHSTRYGSCFPDPACCREIPGNQRFLIDIAQWRNLNVYDVLQDIVVRFYRYVSCPRALSARMGSCGPATSRRLVTRWLCKPSDRPTHRVADLQFEITHLHLLPRIFGSVVRGVLSDTPTI